jgi:tetratricopeptide (TPR) repeat protein
MARHGSSPSRGGRNEEENYIQQMMQEARMLHQEGRIDEAIELCEELIATTGSRDARYYLAWLYQEEHIWDGAIEHYTALLDDLDFALSCFYALGQCYRSKGDLKTAVHFFDEAVERVNLDALEHDEADQLIQLCHEAARTHDDINDREGADGVYSALLGFLRSRGWQDHVAEAERLMAQRVQSQGGRSFPGAGASRQSIAMPAVPKGPSPAASLPPGSMPPAPPASVPPIPTGSVPPMPVAPPAQSLPPAPAAPATGGGFDAFLNDQAQPSAGASLAPAVIPTPGAPVPAPGLSGLGGSAVAGMSNLPSAIGPFGVVPPQLPEPQRTQVINLMRNVNSYIAVNLFTAAIEECLRIIEIAPQYIDVHQALAEIYVQQGKIDQAITKYAVLSDTFLTNGRIDEAIAAHRRILQLEPNNLTYRVRLINLLAQHGRVEEVQRERIAAAETYLRMGYPDRAIEQFEQALISTPGNLSLRQSYALALIRAGRVSQGLGELQRILQVEPNNVLALARWQITLCSGAGPAMPAVNSASSGLRLVPGEGATRVASVEILSRLTRALRAENLRGLDEVMHEYTSALETAPTNGDLRYALAVLYHIGGRAGEAVSSYQSVMTIPGLEILAHVGAGMALLQSSDTSAANMAVREFEEAGALLRRAPISPALWAARPRLDGEESVAPDVEIPHLLSRAYQRSNNTNNVNNAVVPFSRSSPGVGGGQVMTGTPGMPARMSSAVSDEIYRTINEIAVRHPNDPVGTLQEMVQLVRHYRGQRQYEQSVMVLNEITRIAPEDASVRAELADIHITRGLLDEGIEELRRVVDIYTRKGQVNEASQVLQQIGEIQWQMGEHAASMAVLKQALNLTPDDMATRMLYVQYCLELGMRQEAAEQQTVLARYYYHSRRTKEAVAMLQQLIALDSSNHEAYDLLGQTYLSVGEYDQALRVYRHLVKINPANSVARERLAQIQEMRSRR